MFKKIAFVAILCSARLSGAVGARDSAADRAYIAGQPNPVQGFRHLLSFFTGVPVPAPAAATGEEEDANDYSMPTQMPPPPPTASSTTTETTSEQPMGTTTEEDLLRQINETINAIHDKIGNNNTSTSSSSTSTEAAVAEIVNKTASIVSGLASVAEAAVEEIAMRAAHKIIEHIEAENPNAQVTVIETVIEKVQNVTGGEDSTSSASAVLFEFSNAEAGNATEDTTSTSSTGTYEEVEPASMTEAIADHVEEIVAKTLG
jgi:hypothetical protein